MSLSHFRAGRRGGAVPLCSVLPSSGSSPRDGGVWYWRVHAGNCHHMYAVEIASSLRRGDLPALLFHFQNATVWPPLHGLAAGAVMAVGGLDYRLAVLPSLFSWAGAAVVAYL